MSWVERDLATAREGLRILNQDGGDPEGRMSAQLLARGAKPATERDPSLGHTANIILAEPGIVQRIRDEGFDARLAGVAANACPETGLAQCGWWRDGWYAADANVGDSE